MSRKVTLSYSTINLLYTASHNWLNKMMKIKPEDRPWFAEGRAAHQIIQKHVSGEKPEKRLEHINFTFPIVERVEFDPKCKFSLEIDATYEVIGYVDGLDPENKRILEIKTSSTVWSIKKFKESMQRKVYALARPDFMESVLITAKRDPEKWSEDVPKVFTVPITERDRKEALKWIYRGIEILEKGDFSGGLDENDKCTDQYCLYGNNCQFK